LCSCALMSCYPLALLLYLEYESVKDDPAIITFFVRLNLFLLMLTCFAFIILYSASVSCTSVLEPDPSRNKKPKSRRAPGKSH
jgi:hypothetical protein